MTTHKSLIVYLTAGYPDRRMFLKAARTALDEGADLLEVGLPFSDPIADGPVIQSTSRQAILSGMDFDSVLDLSAGLPNSIPRALMTYSNPLFVRGWSNSFSQIRRAGFSGCVIPDVPAEEVSTLLPFRPSSFYIAPFVAPTTAARRLAVVADAARDGAFIYLVSLRGITGADIAVGRMPELARLTRAIRKVSHAPIFAGFGVRSARDAAAFAKIADGVIVGTAALKALSRSLSSYALLIRQLRSGLDRF